MWRQADKYDVPRICFVNKMDKLGADFYFSVQTMKDRLGANVVPIQIPIGSEGDFEGIVDLVEMKAKVWRGETKLGEKYDVLELSSLPDDLQEKAAEYRTNDRGGRRDGRRPRWRSTWAAKNVFFFLSVAEIKSGLRKLTVTSAGYPVLCGSAFKNKGVQPMLDAVIDYLPTPLDAAAAVGHARARKTRSSAQAVGDEPFSGLALSPHPSSAS